MCALVDVDLKIQDLTLKVHPGPCKLPPVHHSMKYILQNCKSEYLMSFVCNHVLGYRKILW